MTRAKERTDRQAQEQKNTHVNTPENQALEFVQQNQGQPLDTSTQETIEPKFAHDFANIRVFADGQAPDLADRLDARAFTIGQNIVFGANQYQPHSRDGQGLLAHELAHTVQQRDADLKTANHLEVADRNSGIETEARAASTSVLSGQGVQVSSGSGAMIAREKKGEVTAEDDERAARADDWRFEHDDVDQGATRKEKNRMQNDLAFNPGHVGQREQGFTGGLPEMNLYDKTRAEAGGQVKNFERDYAAFRLPMEMTLETLGRVQDLLTAGAAQTPADLSKDDLKAFGKLGEEQKDGLSKVAFGSWAQDTSQVAAAMDKYIGVFQRLQGSLLLWRAMKERIEMRRKEALLKKDEKKLTKLEAPAKTIMQIVEVFEKGVSMYEGMGLEQAASEIDVDLIDSDVRAGTQKGVGVAGHAKKAAGVIGSIGGSGGLSAESVIQWAMGDSDEIAGLRHSIAQLKADIESAGEKAELFDIDAAKTALDGTKAEDRSAALSVRTERSEARYSASNFAQVIGGKNVNVRLAIQCAEAYQELWTFGQQASEAYNSVAKSLPAIQQLISQREKQGEIKWARDQRRASLEPGDVRSTIYSDYEDIMESARTAKSYGALLAKELPEWKNRANQWNGFFQHQTGMPLNQYGKSRSKNKP